MTPPDMYANRFARWAAGIIYGVVRWWDSLTRDPWRPA